VEERTRTRSATAVAVRGSANTRSAIAVAGGGDTHTRWRKVIVSGRPCRGVVTDPYLKKRLDFACKVRRERKGGEEKIEGGG
jgi:hypothetical protein